jgi:SfnB family sulfur acquisition oxidoreductase
MCGRRRPAQHELPRHHESDVVVSIQQGTPIVSTSSTPAARRAEVDQPAAYPSSRLTANPAHIIRSADEAIAVAHDLAGRFAEEASERDRDRRLPVVELEAFSQSGLWGITVPKAYGGAEVSVVTLTEVIKILAAADPSLAQIPQNHLVITDAIRLTGSEEQKRHFFAEVLKGARFGNAFSEFHGKNVADFQTRFAADGDRYLVNGKKFYSTGALFAHYVVIGAVNELNQLHLVVVDRATPGVTVIDDWSGFGQRTTASGTVTIDDVRVTAIDLFPVYLGETTPSANNALSQIIQAAIDAGIARAAIADTIKYVRSYARPWIDSGLEHAWHDPYTISAIGDLKIQLHAAEAVLEWSAAKTDAAAADPTEANVAAAQIAVAEAKVLTTNIAILAANKLHELVGTRSTLAAHNLDRHWRNARTHTLHDPARWKYFAIGNYHLNGVNPPRHPWL